MHLDMIVGIFMKPALEQPGCPICSIRNLFETRYLGSLLHEYVNDSASRTHIIASLGYCTKHAWQMAVMERENFGDNVGNAIIYENLVKAAIKPLAKYRQALEDARLQPRPFFHRLAAWLKTIGKAPTHPLPEPYGPLIRETCRVCQAGENAETNYLEWLLRSLSDPEPDLREEYLQSDGLCLHHLRMAISMQTPAVESGLAILIDSALETLPRLCTDLREYTDKHAWDRHLEAMTPGESRSWIQAARFFAGNEGNILLDELVEIPDDRVNHYMKAKYD